MLTPTNHPTTHATNDPARSGILRTAIRWAGTLGMLVLFWATVIRFSARMHWSGELLTSFAWYLGLCGALGAVLLFLCRRRMLAIAALVLSSLHFGPELALWLPPDVQSDSTGQALTLATANLLWHNREYEALSDWIDDNAPDIIAFQEVSPHSRDVLLGMTERYPHMVFEPPLDRWNSLTWGLAFLSKQPIKSQRRWIIPETPWKGVLEVESELDGEALILRNVHPTRPGRAARNAERDSALHVVEAQTWGGQSVLLGDLNVTSTSPSFADLLAATGLRDSREGFGRQATYMLKKTAPLLKVAIDHVLVSPSIAVTDRRVVPLFGSDHDTIVLRIQRAAGTVAEASQATELATDNER